MRNKIQNIQDIEYYDNSIVIADLINKWTKAKPNNKELLDLQSRFIQQPYVRLCG